MPQTEDHQYWGLNKFGNPRAIRAQPCALSFKQNQIPLKVRIEVFKSVVLSHLSFSGVFLQTLTVKNKPHKQAN